LRKSGHDDQGGIPPLAVVRLAAGDAGMDQWGEGEVREVGFGVREMGELGDFSLAMENLVERVWNSD